MLHKTKTTFKQCCPTCGSFEFENINGKLRCPICLRDLTMTDMLTIPCDAETGLPQHPETTPAPRLTRTNFSSLSPKQIEKLDVYHTIRISPKHLSNKTRYMLLDAINNPKSDPLRNEYSIKTSNLHSDEMLIEFSNMPLKDGSERPNGIPFDLWRCITFAAANGCTVIHFQFSPDA